VDEGASVMQGRPAGGRETAAQRVGLVASGDSASRARRASRGDGGLRGIGFSALVGFPLLGRSR
jgi:hypothetical protein